MISGRFEGKDVLVIGGLDAISQVIGEVRLPGSTAGNRGGSDDRSMTPVPGPLA